MTGALIFACSLRDSIGFVNGLNPYLAGDLRENLLSKGSFMSKAWKLHEKRTAEVLGGKRVIRTNFGESKPDVQHPLLSVECKYRAKLSRFLINGLKQAEKYDPKKIPVLVVKEKGMRGAIAILRLEDFANLINEMKGETKNEQ
jgi:hypothetical protein